MARPFPRQLLKLLPRGNPQCLARGTIGNIAFHRNFSSHLNKFLRIVTIQPGKIQEFVGSAGCLGGQLESVVPWLLSFAAN